MRDKYKFIFQEIIFYKHSSVAHLLCRNGKIIKYIVYTIPTEYFGYIKCGPTTNYTSRQLRGSESEIFEINPRIGGSLVLNVNDLHDFLDVAISNN